LAKKVWLKRWDGWHALHQEIERHTVVLNSGVTDATTEAWMSGSPTESRVPSSDAKAVVATGEARSDRKTAAEPEWITEANSRIRIGKTRILEAHIEARVLKVHVEARVLEVRVESRILKVCVEARVLEVRVEAWVLKVRAETRGLEVRIEARVKKRIAKPGIERASASERSPALSKTGRCAERLFEERGLRLHAETYTARSLGRDACAGSAEE